MKTRQRSGDEPSVEQDPMRDCCKEEKSWVFETIGEDMSRSTPDRKKVVSTEIRKRASPRADDSGAQCIHRALRVMRLLASSPSQGDKLVDIAAKLELSHPTTHRILKALEQEGVVERALGSRRYMIGSEMAWLGLGAASRFPITAAATKALDQLSEQVGDSVFLSVHSGNDAIYADRRIGSYPIQANRLSIGARRPLGISIGSRAMLAYMPERSVRSIMEANASRYEGFACSSQELLDSALTARSQGYVCDESLTAKDMRVLAVPILDTVGAPVAAISVIAIRGRLPEARIPAILPALQRTALDISAALSQRLQPGLRKTLPRSTVRRR